MEELIDIVIKIVATLLALGLGWLVKRLSAWIKTKLDEKEVEMLERFVSELVAAAEQMFKAEDPDGSVRLHYVESMLVQAGYDVTAAVTALIESKVFDINLAKKEVGIEDGKPEGN
jgi:hypothetical protein